MFFLWQVISHILGLEITEDVNFGVRDLGQLGLSEQESHQLQQPHRPHALPGVPGPGAITSTGARVQQVLGPMTVAGPSGDGVGLSDGNRAGKGGKSRSKGVGAAGRGVQGVLAAAVAAAAAAERLAQVLWVRSFRVTRLTPYGHTYGEMQQYAQGAPKVLLLGARAEPSYPAFLTLTDDHRVTVQHTGGAEQGVLVSEHDGGAGSSTGAEVAPRSKAVQLLPGQEYCLQVGGM